MPRTEIVLHFVDHRETGLLALLSILEELKHDKAEAEAGYSNVA